MQSQCRGYGVELDGETNVNEKVRTLVNKAVACSKVGLRFLFGNSEVIDENTPLG
jgi:hypothetical protein